jgi:hypothetical protein
LRINKGDNTTIMRATIAIATTAKMPAHQWQWRYHDKGDNASSTTSNKEDNTSLTMAETLAHQQWQ